MISLMAMIFGLSTMIYAQGTVTGTVLDNESGDPLIGVKVILKGTARGAITDIDGKFSFSAEAGEYTLVASYIGYVSVEKGVSVTEGKTVSAGSMTLEAEGIGLDEVNILASVAIDRKTPVAVSTISGAKVEQLVGNQEFPEILRSTPSIYVTKQGGGFGDSRINVRGFDQRNTAVMINGIPVNDMENGWVYWSNWAGLSDVTSTIQVQRGLGASKLAVASVGGSINIVTNAADFQKGGAASVSIGNDGYQKYAAVLSSGLNEKGFAATAQFTHTRGNGWIEGTEFQAYSYFLSLSQRLGDKHTLAFTGLGAPQWHHQNLGAGNFDRYNLQTMLDLTTDDYDGRKFNPLAGTLDGKPFNFRRNFYHKPKFFLNHYWNISNKTSLKSSFYVSLGRGGGTGPRGRLRTPGSIFDSFGDFGSGVHDAQGHIRYDDIVRYNQGQVVDGWGEAKQINPVTGKYTVAEDGRIYYDANGNIISDDRVDFDSRDNTGSGFIRRASMNSHNWFGVLSTLDHKLNNNLTLVAGLDARYYKGIHYRRLENLMGAQAYSSKTDINNMGNIITEPSPATFGNFSDNSYRTGNNVLNYWNDGLVQWLGLFAQLEYSTDRLTLFGSLSGANQGFKRIDYFNYLESDPQRETDWANFLGGTIKAGMNYNINESMNFYVNGGFFSQQPIFDNVYINFVNQLNPDVENQQVYALEAGYGIRSSNFRANLNIYHTQWGNRQFSRSIDVPVNDTLVIDGLANFSGISQLHQGIELEMTWQPLYNLTFAGMVSLNNWRYNDDFTANIQNTDNQTSLGTATIFANGIKVGDAAQTTLNLNANYEIVDGLSVYANLYYADNLYAEFNLTEDQFLKSGGEVVKLPSYSLVDAGASYRLNIGNDVMIFRLNVNNLFDTEYIAEMNTNILGESNLYQNKGFWGFGRTWNAGVKFKF